MTTQASTQPVELDGSDLPAFCPNPKMTLWNSHPRVYLEVVKSGSAACPYCGTVYKMKEGAIIKHGH